MKSALGYFPATVKIGAFGTPLRQAGNNTCFALPGGQLCLEQFAAQLCDSVFQRLDSPLVVHNSEPESTRVTIFRHEFENNNQPINFSSISFDIKKNDQPYVNEISLS